MEQQKVYVLVIHGLVQGVGFRPFVYRIAKEMGICGEVDNRTDGVYIRAVVSPDQKECLLRRIREEHPPVASIHHITVAETEEEATYADFTITPSHSASAEVTQVSPDIAVCPDCLADRRRQPHRIGYPFVNCTHCGPRFTLIKDLPYDRKETTMSSFAMCPNCRSEYIAVADRRFHAQPIACNHCGPIYYATYNGRLYTDYSALLYITCRLLQAGEVIAAKGVGGYHLVCDATNAKAVDRLRHIKRRDNKPFAVMFRDMQTIRMYAQTDAEEEKNLLSWRRPIVLLRQRVATESGIASLASDVNPGMHTLGCMLPYMPIHYDWLLRLDTPALVVTSGNLSDLPIAIHPREADEQLAGEISFMLHHNREIYNRADDSVVQVCGGQTCLVRRSRGYVPEPFFADMPMEGILAFGAEKVNTFALGKGETILQSQYIGDLKNWETFRFYTEAMNRFQQLFRFTPRQLVCDLHPDYLSSREAERLAEAHKLPLLKVQHHHAHAVACMLEHGLHNPVIALVMDGTGLGDDGKVWGGEFLLCTRSRYTRLAHFEYVPLPGGDKASVEPWRMAVSLLWHYGKKRHGVYPFPPGFVGRIGEQPIHFLQQMMEKGVNTPYTSSAGRLFDAVASLLGICDYSTRQAEAPVLLEQCAIEAGEDALIPYSISSDGSSISLQPLLCAILQDQADGVPTCRIAARFHATLAHLLAANAIRLMRQEGLSQVVLSGGCFQNRLLTEVLQRLFSAEAIPLFIPQKLPCNDSAISVGQLAVAAACAD